MFALTWWDNFKINVSLMAHKAVFWVLTIWGVVKVYWETMMTQQEHQAFFDAMPFGMGKFAPIAFFAISYFIANGWPQPKLAEKKDEKIAEAMSAKIQAAK